MPHVAFHTFPVPDNSSLAFFQSRIFSAPLQCPLELWLSCRSCPALDTRRHPVIFHQVVEQCCRVPSSFLHRLQFWLRHTDHRPTAASRLAGCVPCACAVVAVQLALSNTHLLFHSRQWFNVHVTCKFCSSCCSSCCCCVKNDEGGSGLNMQYRFTSFIKTRLVCAYHASSTSENIPVHFNEIRTYSSLYVDKSKRYCKRRLV